MERPYESDLSDAQWECIEDLVYFGTGRKARIDRRCIVNAILYVARTGCQWRQLPHDFPNWSTVYSCYHRWAWNGVLDKIHAALRDQVRRAAGKSPQPTAASVDSQSVKTVAKGGSRVCCNAAMMEPSS
jgi:transposase